MSILQSIGFLGDIHSNIFLDIAILLIVGIIGGKAAELVKLPKVTGYIIVGLLIGPSALGIFNKEMLAEFKSFKILALGFIGYNIGLEVKLRMLNSHSKSVIIITITQILLSFVIVGTVVGLLFGEYQITYGLIFGAIATVTTPAPIVACIKCYDLKGSLTDLVSPLVALDDVFGVIIFAFVLPISIYFAGHSAVDISLAQIVSEPLFEITFGLIAGFVIGKFIVLILRYYYKGDAVTIFIIVFIGIFTGIGLAYMIDASAILLPLVIGATLSNTLDEPILSKVKLGTDAVILPILMIFFTLSGAELVLNKLGAIGLIGLVYIFIRSLAKVFAATLGAKISKEPEHIRKNLGFTLIPQGGVAIEMALLAEIRFYQLATETLNSDYEVIGSTIFTIILGATLIYKLFGEIIVKWAFKRAGEICCDDHEHHTHIV